MYVLLRLLKDFILVGLFVLQHSLMASDRWKRLLLCQFNACISDRLIYVIASCFTLIVSEQVRLKPEGLCLLFSHMFIYPKASDGCTLYHSIATVVMNEELTFCSF